LLIRFFSFSKKESTRDIKKIEFFLREIFIAIADFHNKESAQFLRNIIINTKYEIRKLRLEFIDKSNGSYEELIILHQNVLSNLFTIDFMEKINIFESTHPIIVYMFQKAIYSHLKDTARLLEIDISESSLSMDKKIDESTKSWKGEINEAKIEELIDIIRKQNETYYDLIEKVLRDKNLLLESEE
jgi:hypothetical protein